MVLYLNSFLVPKALASNQITFPSAPAFVVGFEFGIGVGA